MKTLSLVVVAVLTAIGCGSGSGTLQGTYAVKCHTLCDKQPKDPTGFCAAAQGYSYPNLESVDQCQGDCIGKTEGLAVVCAQCIIENSHWTNCDVFWQKSSENPCKAVCQPAGS